jgi:hypothetical protein
MDSYVIFIGCIRNDVDFNIYMMKQEGKFTMIVLYIDNTMLVSNAIFLLQQMKKILEFEIEMTNLKYIHFYIGIQMIRNQEDGWIRMSLKKYLLEILHKFGMTYCKLICTLVEINAKLNKDGCPQKQEEDN